MKLKDSGMQLTIGIGNTSSIDKECAIYRRGIQNPNYPGFLYLMRDPSDNVTPKREGRARINETRKKVCNGGQYNSGLCEKARRSNCYVGPCS